MVLCESHHSHQPVDMNLCSLITNFSQRYLQHKHLWRLLVRARPKGTQVRRAFGGVSLSRMSFPSGLTQCPAVTTCRGPTRAPPHLEDLILMRACQGKVPKPALEPPTTLRLDILAIPHSGSLYTGPNLKSGNDSSSISLPRRFDVTPPELQ